MTGGAGCGWGHEAADGIPSDVVEKGERVDFIADFGGELEKGERFGGLGVMRVDGLMEAKAVH